MNWNSLFRMTDVGWKAKFSDSNLKRTLPNSTKMLSIYSGCCSQDLKTQLAKEREQVRHVTLQKDLDTKELHARIDRAVRDVLTLRVKPNVDRFFRHKTCLRLGSPLWLLRQVRFIYNNVVMIYLDSSRQASKNFRCITVALVPSQVALYLLLKVAVGKNS